jgi:hypothetical protein
LDTRDRSAQKFKYLLGVINETLVTTHRMVISRLATLQHAETVEEAKALLEKLRLVELSEAFRVEGLCDLLEGLGNGLYSRVLAARKEGYFSGKELTDMQAFAMTLYDREDEVARVYSTVLTDVAGQGRLLDENSLPELQGRAQEAEALLTAQLSDFSEKADKFMRLSAP